jgi:hypothetical protein
MVTLTHWLWPMIEEVFMNKRKLIIGAATVAVLAVVACAWGFLGGTDPAVAELQQMAEKAFDSDMPESQRDQFRDDFRERMRALSDNQRQAFFDANRDRWMQRIEERMDEFFALPAAEQQKRLDEILDRMSRPREDRSQGADRGDRGRDSRGPGNWANMTEAQRDERSKRRLDQTSPKLRAQFSEFRRRLDERSKQRGMGERPRRGFFGA